MADGFSVTCTGPAGASGTPVTIGTLIASTSIRGFVEGFSIGTSSTPADHALNWILQRFTAAGTAGSAVTPAAQDSAAPASLITAGQAHSVEPTYTAAKELYQQGVNQRASFAQYRRPGRELIIPATSANGIGMAAADATTGPPTCEVTFEFHQ
jgi:hypothetical protein